MEFIAYWGFVAIVTVAGMWVGDRAKTRKQEGLLRLLENGENLDKETLDMLYAAFTNKVGVDTGLKIGAAITGAAGAGFLLVGSIFNSEGLNSGIFAIGIIVCFVAAGQLLAGKICEKSFKKD